LLQFGSQLLGTADEESDVDLCLTSFETLLNRYEFFDYLTPLLRSDKVKASYVHDIREAFVPIIRFELSGVKFDLVYVAMNRPTEYDQKILKDYLLDDIHIAPDKQSFNSAQGYLQSRALMSCIPNIEVFRSVLRVVKCWAKKRGIYSSNYGYLNGITLQIMVAYIQINLREEEFRQTSGPGNGIHPISSN